jgi:hypothetical protein
MVYAPRSADAPDAEPQLGSKSELLLRDRGGRLHRQQVDGLGDRQRERDQQEEQEGGEEEPGAEEGDHLVALLQPVRIDCDFGFKFVARRRRRLHRHRARVGVGSSGAPSQRTHVGGGTGATGLSRWLLGLAGVSFLARSVLITVFAEETHDTTDREMNIVCVFVHGYFRSR